MRTKILGVGFDDLTMEEAVKKALSLMEERRGAYIVTPNPEIVLLCRRDAQCARAVEEADLSLADGVGDLYTARLLGRPLKERVSGSDLAPRLLQELAARNGSVFLFGARPGVAERAAVNLQKVYPGLRVLGTENGYITDDGPLLARLEALRPDLLLVGMGAPKQEVWMARHRGPGRASLMMAVGGCLDVFAGDVRRAPESWRRRDLEWLYRLFQNPRRLGRVLRLPWFLFLALRERATGRH